MSRFINDYCSRLFKFFLTLNLILTCNQTHAQQTKVVFSGTSYVVLSDSAKFFINNPIGPNLAIVSSGGNGFISEGEFNQVVLTVGSFAGSFKIPFVSSNSLTDIPLTFDVANVGVGNGIIKFATYGCPTWDNNVYKPSDVTHMNDYNTALVNNSDHVIDRFWIIDAADYTTKPEGTLKLTYLDNELTSPGNFMTELGIGAQRFNSTTSQWGDYLPQGNVNAVANTLSDIPVSASGFFRSWTISEVLVPLADFDISVEANCINENTNLHWEIEQNIPISRFEIELYNGEEFVKIGSIEANNEKYYEFSIPSQDILTYRIALVDFDGEKSYSETITTSCNDNEETELIFNDYDLSWWLRVDSKWKEDDVIQLYDITGKLIYSETVHVEKGENMLKINTESLQNGTYFVSMNINSEVILKRFVHN